MKFIRNYVVDLGLVQENFEENLMLIFAMNTQ